MVELTKAEEQVMHIIWDLQKGFVKDLIEIMPEPKPAYNTISTICRILEKKEFVAHKKYGGSFQYYPLVSKEDYTEKYLSKIMSGYFNNSFKSLVSFFTKKSDIDMKDADEIIKMMESIKTKKNK